MAVNYEDERFETVEQERQDALDKAEATYGGMIEKSNQLYQEQIDATKAWEEQQKQLQQQQTDFAIQETERKKEQAQKDYAKEQSAAYADWQKEKNAYGVHAEQMAEAGLAGSGYSESARVSMYNTYQARVTAAKESITLAIADFDAAMQSAVLQNDVAMAEIAFQALQQRMTLSLEGFQYENQLIFALEDEKKAIDSQYDSKWQDVLAQLYAEEAAAIRNAQSGGLDEEMPDDLELTDPDAVITDDSAGANAQGNTAVEAALSDDGSGGWYFPGAPEAGAKKPSAQAIKNMQASLGVPQTGRWDAASRKAAGTQSVIEAYALWNQGKIGQSLNPLVTGNKQPGSWRQEDRPNEPRIVIDKSIPKMISDEELDRMLDSGEAVVVPMGDKMVVMKTNGLGKQMATIAAGTNWHN